MTGGGLLLCNDGQCLWIFGYGSLTWKVNFPYRRKVVGYIKGYVRRFYQGSCDHRGVPGKKNHLIRLLAGCRNAAEFGGQDKRIWTPDNQKPIVLHSKFRCIPTCGKEPIVGLSLMPGRVATLLDDKEGVVWGVAYEVEPAEIENVLMYLDIREKNGYKSSYTTLYTINHCVPSIKVMLYIATPENSFYLGPATASDIAKQIVHSEGPSGKNSEYLLNLAAFMREIRKQHENCKDEHLFELEALVKNGLAGIDNVNKI